VTRRTTPFRLPVRDQGTSVADAETKRGNSKFNVPKFTSDFKPKQTKSELREILRQAVINTK
jgi:hypothetical protein